MLPFQIYQVFFFLRALITFFFYSELKFDIAAVVAKEMVLFNYLPKVLLCIRVGVYDTNRLFMHRLWTFVLLRWKAEIESARKLDKRVMRSFMFLRWHDKKQTFYSYIPYFCCVFTTVTCFLVSPLWGFEWYQLSRALELVFVIHI